MFGVRENKETHNTFKSQLIVVKHQLSVVFVKNSRGGKKLPPLLFNYL